MVDERSLIAINAEARELDAALAVAARPGSAALPGNGVSEDAVAAATQGYQLRDFWALDADERERVLVDAILRSHAWHYSRNKAYRMTVAARGVGPAATPNDLPRLLRPTAQTFKSYADLLGTPFPQHQPQAFLAWLADQLSIELPADRFRRFRRRYRSLEALLADFERIYADLGLEILTSSGTSGRSTIMVRDQDALDKTTESFYLCFQRYFGMQASHRAIFFMPQDTRIAMARMAAFSVARVWAGDPRIHFTIPFPAYPDQVRVRAGRTFRPGLAGAVEQRLLHPFMVWMNEHYVSPRAVRTTIVLLQRSAAAGEKVLLFGGLVQLHLVAQELLRSGQTIALAPGSLLGTGGGLKERYATPPAEIRRALAQVFTLTDGQPIMIVDTYGMAEGNWAAMQCRVGNYHLPPWLYTATLDADDRLQTGPDTSGLLAFFDPFGGGNLFPPFFKTADRVRLIRGDREPWRCACGDPSAYLAQDSIQRVDLLDEAGCAAQV